MGKKVFLYMSYASHNVYDNMVANAPEDFEFAESEFMAHGAIRLANDLPSVFSERAKEFVTTLQTHLSPYYTHAQIQFNRPKMRRFCSNNYDLVHSAHTLLRTDLPYVVDFEHVTDFSGYNQYALRRPGFVRALERLLLNKKLKKLLAWSDAAGRSLTNVINNEEVTKKLETFYPMVRPATRVPRTSSTFNFLFIGNKFYAKGGYESLLAFEELAQRYDCRFTAIGHIPPEVFARFGANPKITLLRTMPHDRLREFYCNSDVFVFPTHYDTYGLVITEALSFGLPVISAASLSTPELVQHEKTGLLVHTYFSSFADDCSYVDQTPRMLEKARMWACKNPPKWFIERLRAAMERLLTDDQLRNECARNAINETGVGKFSPQRSREKLKRIYSEALGIC
jgi:glycosyltransferase involved in cell wall biosynthesis